MVFFNYDGFIVSLQRHVGATLDALNIEWREAHISEALAANLSFQPTMTLFFHPSAIWTKFRPDIAKMYGHKSLWSMEDPYESDITFDLMAYCGHVLTNEETMVTKLKEQLKDKHVYFMPHSYNPAAHHPMNWVPYEYRSDILFVGNAYPSRLKWFREHADEYRDKLVTIVGVGYRGLAGYQHQRLIHGHISEPEMVKYINGAKLVLNLHRQNSDLDMANHRKLPATSFNNRYYEVAACGADQLVVGRGEPFLVSDVCADAKLTCQEVIKGATYAERLGSIYVPLLEKP